MGFIVNNYFYFNIELFKSLTGKSYKKENKDCEIYPDRPIDSEENDVLGFSEQIADIVNKIGKLDRTFSWSIALTAPWGNGKSSFMNLLRNKLNSGEYEILQYNPRCSKNARTIQEDFLLRLSSVLGKYSSQFTLDFKDYMRQLQIGEYNRFTKLLMSLTVSNYDARGAIDQSLKKLNKRIVVLLEDFDRLTGQEMMECLKLIDVNASFPGIIFISAFDKSYADGVLNRYLNASVQDASLKYVSYLDKYYDWEYPIMKVSKERYFSIFKDKLFNGLGTTKEDLVYKDKDLNKLSQFLMKHIHNMRDIYRFCNLFISSYKSRAEYVVFSDFILLTLLLYRYPEKYQNLRTRYLKLQSGILIYDDNLNDLECAEILQYLFPKNVVRGYQSIQNLLYFDDYFVHDSGKQPKRKDLQDLFTLERRTLFTKLSDLVNKNQISYLSEYLSRLEWRDVINDTFGFEEYTNVIFFLWEESQNNHIVHLVHQLLYNGNYDNNGRQNSLYKNLDNYKILIKKILIGDELHSFHKICRNYLLEHYENPEDSERMIFTKDELLSICIQCLDNAIQFNSVYSPYHLDILYSCISKVERASGKIILDRHACEKVYRLILENPEEYIKSFVRLGMASSNEEVNTIACEPYWKQIFTNEHNFERFLETDKVKNSPYYTKIKNFWILYSNNNYESIPFNGEGNVQKKIDSDMVDEMARLIVIQNQASRCGEIANQISDINNPGRRDMLIKELNEMKGLLQRNAFYITKNGETHRLIDDTIQKLKKIQF